MPPRRWGKARLKTEGGEVISHDVCEHPEESTRDVKPKPALTDQQFDPCDGVSKSLNLKGSMKENMETMRRYRFKEWGELHDVLLSSVGQLPAPALSDAAVEYRLQLRAHWLKRQGYSQANTAQEIKKPVGWVGHTWQQSVEKIPRPRDVAKYISLYEQKMLKAGIEPFKPPSLHRQYAPSSAGVYEECAAAFPWQQAVLRKRNYETGEVTITNTASSRQDCCFPTLRTGLPRVDSVIDRVRQDFDIRDPGAYLMCNWYPDGNTNIAPHQHDFWSAILCFGASRVFMLDNEPLLLNSGDLLVFGTQKHSVPRMPDVQEGRISVAIFWYPERTAADGSFKITLDPALAETALANDFMAKAIAVEAARAASQVQLDVGGRGVGKYEEEHVGSDEEGEIPGFLSEDRLVAIALKLSMVEQ
eukprot:gnl/MRDRNA2_/MRDRNA2_57360_c0_seq1.p1 gnl/MRDRNA2_/MRDRNA2_57360_c0~~gnl/MRDRNA2_/MRDRNA2_57360_c0_seq1.p1  ORF type:complete len:417 (+),score=74.96 gnl/MRDRNA2_/MRDRNA2_57360_c0_seq1:93-1343(+)